MRMARFMLWSGTLALVGLEVVGLKWVAENIRRIQTFDLFLALLCLNILAFMHYRCWALRKVVDEEVQVKLYRIMVSYYCLLYFALWLLQSAGR